MAQDPFVKTTREEALDNMCKSLEEDLDDILERVYHDEVKIANRKSLDTWKGILMRRKITLGVLVVTQVLLLAYIAIDLTLGWQL